MSYVNLEVGQPAPPEFQVPESEGAHWGLGANGFELRVQLPGATAKERRQLHRVTGLGLYVAPPPAPIAFPLIRFGQEQWWMDTTFDARRQIDQSQAWLAAPTNSLLAHAFDGRIVLCNHLVGMPEPFFAALAAAVLAMIDTAYSDVSASMAIANAQKNNANWLLKNGQWWPIR